MARHKRLPPLAAPFCAALLCAMLACLPAPASAHSLRAFGYAGRAMVVEAVFGGGEAACYAEVTVYAPGQEQEFQNGRTDAKGRFAFLPDRPGAWKLVIDAGMGHRTEYEVEVHEKDLP